ncbi:MAG: hypothetical protein AB1529_04940 [Candidatus Micrarchaeota archaeon]
MAHRLLSGGVKSRLAVAALGAFLAVEPVWGCATMNTTAVQSRIVSMLDASGRETAEKALTSAMDHAPPDSRGAFERLPENLEAGRRLARELGLEGNDVDALNFGYAISSVGEGMTRSLNRELGIRFFMRYSRRTLLEVHASLASSSPDPLLLVAFNKSDWNGAFYREGMNLEALLPHYKVLLVEVENEGQLYSRMRDISAAHGRISAMVIGGHGLPESIQLGAQDEAGRIDTSDGTELEGVRGTLIAHPLVVLVSCSTGQSDKAVGALISRSWNADLFAPVTPSSRTVFHLGADGSIERVSYDVETRRFAASGG